MNNALVEEPKWHTPQVNKDKVWRGYVDSYDDHAFGILQENGQNSFDAYPADTPAKEMKIVIKYDADKRILSQRDFNTLGMGHCRECNWGVRDNGIECTNNDCAWGCFHNMGYSSKAGMALGSRGMGKALQLLSGNRMVIKTTLPDGRHQASVWEMVKGDWQWRFAPEHDELLSAPGTEIISFNIVDKVHDQLLKADEVIAELQERWFRLVSLSATIEYILMKDGKSDRFFVKSPHVPPLDNSQSVEKAHLVMSSIVVKYQGKRLGEIRNLNLFLAKKPFGEEDRGWGVALVKNGKQTITRFTEFPEEIPENLRKRVFGYCDIICTSEEPFLKEAENAQHTNFQYSHPTYKSVRRELRDITRNFVQPFLRSGGERVTEKEQLEAAEILGILNKALEEVPEFGLFGKEEVSPRRAIETTPKDYIYLSRLEFENRMYKRGEKVLIEAVIKNPTSREVAVMANFEHFDPTPVVVESYEDGVIIQPGSPKDPGTNSIRTQLSFEQSQAPGIHWIQVSLSDVKRQPLIDNEGHQIRMRRHIYCELEPRKIVRTRSGSGEPQGGEGTGGGEGAFGLAAIQWFKKPELADSAEAHLDLSQAIAFVNLKGRRLEFYRAMSKSRQGYWPAVIEIIGEKILEKKAEYDAGEKEEWQAEELKNKVIQLTELKSKLVRKAVELLG